MNVDSATVSAFSTRDQILHAASDLIQTRSYLGFSFQDVANKVGIRKASLYHHFPTKEALGVEVLRAADQGFRSWTVAKTRTPQESIDAYFRMYRTSLRAGEGVCPAGALAPGWDCINDELRQAVRELRSTQILWLTGVLGALAPAGRPSASDGASASDRVSASDTPSEPDRPSTPVSALAAFVFSVCQGALLSARMTGRVQDFDEAVDQLKRSISN